MNFLPDWCRAEITEIQDLTYGVIPKLLPCEAIKEQLTKPTKQTEKQHAMVLNSIPTDWLQILKTETAKPEETFCIKLTPDTKPIEKEERILILTLTRTDVGFELSLISQSEQICWGQN